MIRKDEEKRKNMKLNKEDFLVFRAIQYNTERATQRNTQQYKTEQYEAIYIYKYRYKCTIQRGAAMEGSCIPVCSICISVYHVFLYRTRVNDTGSESGKGRSIPPQ